MADSEINGPLRDDFENKIKVMADVAWDSKCDWPTITAWLAQFNGASTIPAKEEQLCMLHLLSNFIYFGSREIRELLRAVYRDLFRYKIVEKLRKDHGSTGDHVLLNKLFSRELKATRFLALGTPAESSSYLLYPFRQINELSKSLFAEHGQLKVTGTGLRSGHTRLHRIVFIDDLCGSGDQVTEYAGPIVQTWKDNGVDAQCLYYVLFASSHGLREVRSLGLFDDVACIYELDDDFRAFSSRSLLFRGDPPSLDRARSRKVAKTYGARLAPRMPLGYKDGQLLLGFEYNTPDNTLPVFWFDEPQGPAWISLFPRYSKK